MYVFGSYATGDFAPDSSDIDFLGVSRRPLSRPETLRLGLLHDRLASRSRWGALLEGGYAARLQIRPWGLEGMIAAVEPGRPLVPSVPGDYSADNMLALREHGRALQGPPPSELIPAVERRVLEAALREYLEDLLIRPRRLPAPATPDAKLGEWLLNAARCLYGIRTGRLTTKTAAAWWLSGEVPALASALQTAIALRQPATDGGGSPGDHARLLDAFAALHVAYLGDAQEHGVRSRPEEA